MNNNNKNWKQAYINSFEAELVQRYDIKFFDIHFKS